MNEKKPAKWISSDWVFVPVSFLTLVTFVVAQSVYEILIANSTFLAVRRVSDLQLLGIVAVFNLLPALILFLLWVVLRLLHQTLARVFLSFVYFALFLGFFLQLHNVYWGEWQPFPYSYVLWVVLAALLLFVSLRFEKLFRSFIITLSLIVLISPALFLSFAWTGPKKLPPGQTPARQKVVSHAENTFPPVFLLVLDGLTQHALLDDLGQINADRFPNFEKLASESYWFRNTTANAVRTTKSIPIILTGNFAFHGNPSYEAYPNNLLALLQPRYDIYAREISTHFCKPRLFHCPDAEVVSSHTELLRDIFYLYAARVLPKSVNLPLPNLTTTWGPFRWTADEVTAHIERFQVFVDSLSSIHSDNFFYFMHHMLPHEPYAVTAEGRVYTARPISFTKNLAGNNPVLEDLRDRYLMQIAYVDKELGNFVAKLRQLGLYDKSIIIITSDHGISWKPEAPGRVLSKKNAEMILSVPLFIKTPFQKQGLVSNRDVQHIDLLPTVADLLDLEISWEHIGTSVFKPDVRARQKIAYDDQGTRLEFPKNLGLVQVNIHFDVKEALWIGQKIETFEVNKSETIKGYLDTISVLHVRAQSLTDEFPIYVSGWAVRQDAPGIPEEIALAVNGEIVAVASPCCERPDIVESFQNQKLLRSGWAASFSSRKLSQGVSRLTAYVVLDAKKRKLATLNVGGNNLIRVGEVKPSPLIGKRIDTFEAREYDTVKGYLDGISRPPSSVRQDGRRFPVNVRGWAVLIGGSTAADQIAIALNDEIVAVTSPCCDRPDIVKSLKNPKFLQSGWRTSFSSQKLREGENSIAAYVVLDAELGKLAILNTVQNTIQVTRK